MKNIVLLIIVGALAITVMAQKKGKIPHDFPTNMLPAVKQQFIVEYEKGQVLWTLNCARCHNTTSGKKVIVPDFKPEQLKGYELRVINATHESEIPETTVTAEELGQIMTFLTYKKKNK
jgi:hypothetical protein